MPELYLTVLAALKAKCVVSTLFSAFAPEPIATRLERGEATALVTTEALYLRKVASLRDRLPNLRHVVFVGEEGAVTGVSDTHAWSRLMAAASVDFVIPPSAPEDMALLHFTRGTTGRPKGAVHVHDAVVMLAMTGLMKLDLHADDIFWCTSDPGWVTGTSCGIIAPLVNGVTTLVGEAEFDATTWYDVLEKERVSVWYTAPTAIRMMMKLGAEPPAGRELSALRFKASVGEPLNPEDVVWSQQPSPCPFTTTGGRPGLAASRSPTIAAMDVKPGSMGRPLPGITAAIVERVKAGLAVIEAPMVSGELALRAGCASMMRGYLHGEARYAKCFGDGWYLTGNLAMRDAEGYFWFVGRTDAVIHGSGHLIGPFEVGSALMEHPAVAEAGVIGKPDPTAGEIVKAFVALKPGFEAGEALQQRTARPRAQASLHRRCTQGDRLPPEPAQDTQRRYRAAPAEGAQARPAGRRSLHPGKRRTMTTKVHLDRAPGMALLRVMMRICAGEAPMLLECATFRFRAHSMFDAQLYRTKDEIEERRDRGPIRRFRGWLEHSGLLHGQEMEPIEAAIRAEVADAVAFAEAAPLEDVAELERFVSMEAVRA